MEHLLKQLQKKNYLEFLKLNISTHLIMFGRNTLLYLLYPIPMVLAFDYSTSDGIRAKNAALLEL